MVCLLDLVERFLLSILSLTAVSIQTRTRFLSVSETAWLNLSQGPYMTISTGDPIKFDVGTDEKGQPVAKNIQLQSSTGAWKGNRAPSEEILQSALPLRCAQLPLF